MFTNEVAANPTVNPENVNYTQYCTTPVFGSDCPVIGKTVIKRSKTAFLLVVKDYKTKVDTLISRAKELVAKGTPKDQSMTELKTDDLVWKLNLTGERLDKFYDELSKSR
jgi:hypothetical protein